MAQVIYTAEGREHLAPTRFDSEHDRLQTQVAVLIGEAQWRQLLTDGGEEELRQQEGATDELIAFFRAIAEGKGQPPMCSVELDTQQLEQIAQLPAGERQQARTLYEIAALVQEAEAVLPPLAAEEVAERRQYPLAREEAIQAVLASTRAEDPELADRIEDMFYEHNKWMGEDIDRCAFFAGEGEPYLYELESAVWHRFASLDKPGDPEQAVPITRTVCGKRCLGEPDMPPSFNRVMIVMHLATTEPSDQTICQTCLPGVTEPPVPAGTLPY
jgi:hypothetical protein